GADVDLPAEEPLAGAAILACPEKRVSAIEGFFPLTRIGTAGGGKLLGRKLDDLRAEFST
ncbi:MAG TPA: hypothetical protein VIU16_03825, partial [Gaiellaceae bacterium]